MTDSSRRERGVIDPDFERDVLELDIPMEVLLLDRAVEKNIFSC